MYAQIVVWPEKTLDIALLIISNMAAIKNLLTKNAALEML